MKLLDLKAIKSNVSSHLKCKELFEIIIMEAQTISPLIQMEI